MVATVTPRVRIESALPFERLGFVDEKRRVSDGMYGGTGTRVRSPIYPFSRGNLT